MLEGRDLRVGIAFLLAARDQRRVKKTFKQNATTEQKAWVITGAYLGLIVIVYGLFHSADSSLGQKVEQANLNSLGDFLAGVFAPLAFLWLVVSVKTQSKELAAQREELAMTRKEFVDNRGVMEKQAEAAEAHKNFVQQQTEIMSRQAALADEVQTKNYKMLLFEKRVEIYDELKIIHKQSQAEFPGYDYSGFHHLINKARFVFPTELEQWFQYIEKMMDDHYSGTTEEKRAIEFEFLEAFEPSILHETFREHMGISD